MHCMAPPAPHRQGVAGVVLLLTSAWIAQKGLPDEALADGGDSAGGPIKAWQQCLRMVCRPRLKHHMDYCMEHPEELSRVAGLQKKVDEVKNVMVDNIEQVRPGQPAWRPARHADQMSVS